MTTAKRWSLATAFICIVAGAGCAHVDVKEVSMNDTAPSRAIAKGFIRFDTHVGGDTRPAVVYVPENYDPGKKWPLIVFLHGIGERGDDGVRQSEVGIGAAIRDNPERFPAIVLMPQCARTTMWSSAEHAQGAPAASHIDAAIDLVLDTYTIDEDRISLTGLSMGGYGVFHYGAREADRFSALMPLCGGGRLEDAHALATRPLWVFHGGADPVVNPKQSRRMVAAVKESGGNVRYTEYPGVGHNCWDETYHNPEVIAWLLAQKR